LTAGAGTRYRGREVNSLVPRLLDLAAKAAAKVMYVLVIPRAGGVHPVRAT
jgi:hypothetical protein